MARSSRSGGLLWHHRDMEQREWVQWHRQYEDPDSPLSRRLEAVVEAIRTSLDSRPPGPITLLSICAGDGRDVATALRGHRRGHHVRGTLIEANPTLAARARKRLAGDGLSRISVRATDASSSRAYRDLPPGDVVLACGVFGNVSDEDVRGFIEHLPSLCAPDGAVVWTRHRRHPDLTPTIRQWFETAGFDTVTFVSPGPNSWSVGVQRRATGGVVDAPLPRDVRLFTFR
jgi:hypothetical protein